MQVTRKQLRDDLMTLLIAGHESTAAVLTWTMHELVQKPQYLQRLREEVCHLLCVLPPSENHFC
jgi:cytochrome P450